MFYTQAEIKQYKTNLDLKKEAWLEQIKYNYKRNMLKWTFGIGLIFVILFNADSFSVYKQLQASPELQDSITEQGLKLNQIGYHSDPDTLNAIEKKVESLKKETSEFKTELKSLTTETLTFSKDLLKDYVAYNIDSSSIKKNILELEKISSLKSIDDQLASLKTQYGFLSYCYITFQKNVVNDIVTQATTGLPLGWKKDYEIFHAPNTNQFWFIVSKFGGLLLTSLLISFGAPFWKSILNALIASKKYYPRVLRVVKVS